MAEGDARNEQEEQELKKQLKFSFLRFLVRFFSYTKSLISLRKGLDIDGTIEGIKRDIDFKGYNLWVLASSIIIASIGLNVNSVALIIGAMLIAPLMGPLMGLGLALGTNDWKMLLRALKNIVVAVIISLIASTIYFKLTPFGEVQTELISRTRPTLLDVVIAIFGGIAGIVAGSRKEKTNVIPGVAIATALMPPLCVAGYGLANLNWPYFFGAFYLFGINAFFIALTTLVFVKYLRFPVAEYLDPIRKKKVTRYIVLFSFLIIIPSAYTFWNAIQESIFKTNAEQFVSENFEESYVLSKKITYVRDTSSIIEVYLIGEIIPKEEEMDLIAKFPNYNLEETQLIIHQSKDKTDEITNKLTAEEKVEIIEEMYQKNQELLQNKEDKIKFLEKELIKSKQDTIPFTSLKQEIKIQYKQAISMTCGEVITTDFENQQDTVLTFFIKWQPQLTKKEIDVKQNSMQEWLRVRLKDKRVQVINY